MLATISTDLIIGSCLGTVVAIALTVTVGTIASKMGRKVKLRKKRRRETEYERVKRLLDNPDSWKGR